MQEVEVHALHLTKPTVKKIMNYSDFLKLKSKNGYTYRAYQINFNLSLI